MMNAGRYGFTKGVVIVDVLFEMRKEVERVKKDMWLDCSSIFLERLTLRRDEKC